MANFPSKMLERAYSELLVVALSGCGSLKLGGRSGMVSWVFTSADCWENMLGTAEVKLVLTLAAFDAKLVLAKLVLGLFDLKAGPNLGGCISNVLGFLIAGLSCSPARRLESDRTWLLTGKGIGESSMGGASLRRCEVPGVLRMESLS